MKLKIDIPEWLYDSILEYPSRGFAVSQLESAILHGTPIPDNATNGQIIQTLFKPNRVGRTDDDVIVENYDFSKEWWNSPYQKGGKK